MCGCGLQAAKSDPPLGVPRSSTSNFFCRGFLLGGLDFGGDTRDRAAAIVSAVAEADPRRYPRFRFYRILTGDDLTCRVFAGVGSHASDRHVRDRFGTPQSTEFATRHTHQ